MWPFGFRKRKNWPDEGTEPFERAFEESVQEIKVILRRYSSRDISRSLFVSSVWLNNIACPMKHLFLATVFLSMNPESFSMRDKIQRYVHFKRLARKLYAACPRFSMLEDYVPEPDWGDVRFNHEEHNYQIFYGNELSNVYDYLMHFQLFHRSLDEQFMNITDRSPMKELENCLRLQEDILSKITSQQKVNKTANFAPAHIEIPKKVFWEDAISYLDQYDPERNLDDAFVANYSIAVGSIPSILLSPNEFVQKAFNGNLLQAFFINNGDEYLPLLPRRYSSVLFDIWAKLYQDNKLALGQNIDHSLMLKGEISRYVDDRIKGETFPFVSAILEDGSPHEFIFSVAFTTGDILVLVCVTQPVSTGHEISEELERIKPDIIKAIDRFDKWPTTLALHLDKKKVEFKNPREEKHLLPLLFIVLPQCFTDATPHFIPNDLPGHIVLLDQFLGLIDEIENANQLFSFVSFIQKHEKQINNPIYSLLDLFGAYRDSHGILVGGALEPTFIGIDPHWGSQMRFDSLSEFWQAYPNARFFSHPRSWLVDLDAPPGQVRLVSRGYFGWSLHCRVGQTHIFLNAPFRSMSHEQVKITNFLMECLGDAFNNYSNALCKHNFFDNYQEIDIIIFPASLITLNKQFDHLRHLDPAGNKWVSDKGFPQLGIPGIRLVYNDDHVIRAFMEVRDRSPQNELLQEILDQLNIFIPDSSTRFNIMSILVEDSNKRPRFVLHDEKKIASFPENTRSHEPELRHYKTARKRIAEIARDQDIKPGHYELETAKHALNKILVDLIADLDAESKKYGFKTALPLLIGKTDALTNKYEHGVSAIRLAAIHEVEYRRDIKYAEIKSEYIRNHRNFRYLIEKFVQLQPGGSEDLAIDQFQILIALVDWLHVFQSASDALHYNIFPLGMEISEDFIPTIHYSDEQGEKERMYGVEEAQFSLDIAGAKNDTAVSSRPIQQLIADLDTAFKIDLGFGYHDMINLLQVLALWAEYNEVIEEEEYYSASADEIESICMGSIKDFAAETTHLILDFLALNKHDVTITVDKDGNREQHNTLPVWEHKKRYYRYTLRPLIADGDKYYWGPHSARKSGLLWTGTTSSGSFPIDMQEPTIRQVLDDEKKLVSQALVAAAFKIVKRYTHNVEKEVWLHKRDKTGNHPRSELGDYDVLAFIGDKNVVLNIECKDINPAYCLKDAKTLRETIFGKPGESEGHFKQINRRQKYLTAQTERVCAALGWRIKRFDLPKVIPVYVSRRTFWWTRFPSENIKASFVRIEMLAKFIEELK